MDFIYLVRVLLKRKWIIIGAGIIAALIAYYFTRNEPKTYRSTAQVSTGFTISDEIKVNENFSFYEADTKFNNAIVTCTSPAVISLLSYKLILHDLTEAPFRTLSPEQKQSSLYQGINKEVAKIVFSNKLETMSMLTSFKPEEKKLIELLNLYGYNYQNISNNLNVYRLQRTDYIQIDFISENPELSAFVVNTIFQQFMRYYKNVRSNKSQESIDTLQSMLEKKKQDLDQKNLLLRGEGIINVDLQNSNQLDIIADLEKTLTEEKTKQTTLYYSLRKINQRLEESRKIPSGDNSSRVPKNNDEVLILRQAMNDAYSDYLKSGSTDKNLLARYNQLKSEYQNKIVNTAPAANDNPVVLSPTNERELIDKKNDIEMDIQAASSNIESIQGKIGMIRRSIVQGASKGAAVETLLKDVEMANKEYLAAKQKYNDAMDMNTSSVNNFRQILVGQPAIESEPSKRKLIVGMAGVATVITSMLVIVLLAYLDSTIKTPVIFSRTVKLKMLSMVNFMDLKEAHLADIVANKEMTNNERDKNRQNIFRESLRKLRYEIESSGKKIFLFTSTKKGQGKTTLIQALSYSMSLSKKRILIIDTNFCNNDLTVQLHADPVLEKIVPGKLNSNNALEQVKRLAKDVGAGSVFAIGSEGGDYTPSEILPLENILKHLQELTTDYDYIFLEGPPLNDFSDSKELAQYVDGVIAVFSATHIVNQIDKESIAYLKELNGKFCGAILNKVDLENVNVT
jgi:succinoglycan biosynthesis transport protein ExoP